MVPESFEEYDIHRRRARSSVSFVELRLEKRRGRPITGEGKYPDVAGFGPRVDCYVCDEASIGRPALWEALEDVSDQAFLLAGRANLLQVQVRRRVACSREDEVASVGRPDRRRLVGTAGRRSGRGAACSVEEPNPRC